MLPGPTIVRTCSVCGKLVAEYTHASGNTCGARVWTDGKMEAPMLPDDPWLVKCGHCGVPIWMDEQEQIGEIAPWGEPKVKFKDVKSCANPSLKDYLVLLAAGVSDIRKERYLRFRVWWAGNDARRRRRRKDDNPLSPAEAANLRALTALLDESDDNDRISKAEAMRELGDYQGAVALLSHPFSPELTQAASIIRDLATHGNPFVSEMTLEQ